MELFHYTCMHSLESCIVDVCVCSVAQSCLFATLWTVILRLLCPWDFPGKNTGMSCHFILQGIFPGKVKPRTPASPAFAGGLFTAEPSGKFHIADRKC